MKDRQPGAFKCPYCGNLRRANDIDVNFNHYHTTAWYESCVACGREFLVEGRWSVEWEVSKPQE